VARVRRLRGERGRVSVLPPKRTRHIWRCRTPYSAGTQAQEADEHRSNRQGCPRVPLRPSPQTVRPGGHLARGAPAGGEGSGKGLVLQSSSEGEAGVTALWGRM